MLVPDTFVPWEPFMNPLSRDARALVSCPICRGKLRDAEAEWQCEAVSCGARFPVVEGVPILINEANSVFSIADFLDHNPMYFRPVGGMRRWVSARLPKDSYNLAAKTTLAKMCDRLRARGGRPKILVIGGSKFGAGMRPLISDPDLEFIETDVAWGVRTQLICDGHDLPFRDATIDGVIIQAVLGAVVDPPRCVAEIHRVLKDDGLVFADTPFMQQVVGREYDFNRFTRLGHRRLFRRFRECESGMTSGPGLVLAWSGKYFLTSFARRKATRAALSGLSRVAFFWLKYFDSLLVNRDAASDAAGSFYFFGEKSSETLADRTLLREYRGGL
jgi:SAM-dependent methyltransferase